MMDATMVFEVLIEDALRALRTHAQEHDVEVREARAAWTQMLIHELNVGVGEVDRNGTKADFKKLIDLMRSRPEENTREYKKHIGILEAAARAGQIRMQMTPEDYDELFNDEWGWRRDSKMSNTRYRSGR